ncbi:MAG TPA: hypothetical protein PLY87_14550 [Planctomycetaceae bacterium]|nr:hypothetical protein [Planctomycetaceae bacterium]
MGAFLVLWLIVVSSSRPQDGIAGETIRLRFWLDSIEKTSAPLFSVRFVVDGERRHSGQKSLGSIMSTGTTEGTTDVLLLFTRSDFSPRDKAYIYIYDTDQSEFTSKRFVNVHYSLEGPRRYQSIDDADSNDDTDSKGRHMRIPADCPFVELDLYQLGDKGLDNVPLTWRLP